MESFAHSWVLISCSISFARWGKRALSWPMEVDWVILFSSNAASCCFWLSRSAFAAATVDLATDSMTDRFFDSNAGRVAL